MDGKSFFKHATVYSLANLLVQAGGFILLPLYTRCLTPAEFGVLEVLGRLAETVGTVLLFGGFRQALLTFYQQTDQEAERRRVVSSTLGLLGFTCFFGGSLAIAFAGPLGDTLNTVLQDQAHPIGPGLLRLAVLGILLEPLTLIPLALLQARMESGLFVLVTLSQFLMRISLCVVLVAWLGWGVAGVLTAGVLTTALYGFGLSFRELVRSATLPSREQVAALLRFALPFVPGGLCFFVLHHGDRFFLFRYCGGEEVGTYALGYKLALAVNLFSVAPLYMVWSVHMYAVARTAEAPVVFGRALTRILTAFVAVGLGLCIFQDEVVLVLAGRAYLPASAIIVPVVLACFCQSAAALMDAGFYVRHRTGRKLVITASATALMLVLYAVLIPRYGSWGAAMATLAGFAFFAAHTWWVTQGIFPVRYEWRRLGGVLGLAAGLWFLSRALPVAVWAAPVKLLLLALWPLLLWKTGLISPEEKEYAGEFLRQFLAPRRAHPAADALPRGRLLRANRAVPPTPAARDGESVSSAP